MAFWRSDGDRNRNRSDKSGHDDIDVYRRLNGEMLQRPPMAKDEPAATPTPPPASTSAPQSSGGSRGGILGLFGGRSEPEFTEEPVPDQEPEPDLQSNGLRRRDYISDRGNGDAKLRADNGSISSRLPPAPANGEFSGNNGLNFDAPAERSHNKQARKEGQSTKRRYTPAPDRRHLLNFIDENEANGEVHLGADLVWNENAANSSSNHYPKIYRGNNDAPEPRIQEAPRHEPPRDARFEKAPEPSRPFKTFKPSNSFSQTPEKELRAPKEETRAYAERSVGEAPSKIMPQETATEMEAIREHGEVEFEFETSPAADAAENNEAVTEEAQQDVNAEAQDLTAGAPHEEIEEEDPTDPFVIADRVEKAKLNARSEEAAAPPAQVEEPAEPTSQIEEPSAPSESRAAEETENSEEEDIAEEPDTAEEEHIEEPAPVSLRKEVPQPSLRRKSVSEAIKDSKVTPQWRRSSSVENESEAEATSSADQPSEVALSFSRSRQIPRDEEIENQITGAHSDLSEEIGLEDELNDNSDLSEEFSAKSYMADMQRNRAGDVASFQRGVFHLGEENAQFDYGEASSGAGLVVQSDRSPVKDTPQETESDRKDLTNETALVPQSGPIELALSHEDIKAHLSVTLDATKLESLVADMVRKQIAKGLGEELKAEIERLVRKMMAQIDGDPL